MHLFSSSHILSSAIALDLDKDKMLFDKGLSWEISQLCQLIVRKNPNNVIIFFFFSWERYLFIGQCRSKIRQHILCCLIFDLYCPPKVV